MALFARALLIGILLALFARTYLVQLYRVPSDSMTPALLPGDHVVVDRFVYGDNTPALALLLPAREPRRFDILVLKRPDGRRLIKRCLGLPGELVELRGHRLWVDGLPLEEGASYLAQPPRAEGPPSAPAAPSPVPATFGPLRLGQDQFLVLGDHREVSLDSRSFGSVGRREIVGRAVFIYWSIPSFDKIPPPARSRWATARWKRCFRPLR